MKYLYLLYIFIFVTNSAFSQELFLTSSKNLSKIELVSENNNLDINSFKISVIGKILNQPIILTPENLGEWGKIYFNVIPPENYSPANNIELSLDSGEVWKPLQESLYYEFEPAGYKTYILSIRIVTNDNVFIKTFNEYPVTYLDNPEKHYSELLRNIISMAFNNKEPSSFMNYVSSTYTDIEDNRYDELEDKLNTEFKKYHNFQFTLKNYEISRLDMAKFKVIFEWAKTFKNKDDNNVENLFGKSVYIFENDLIIQTTGDSIFTDSTGRKQIAANPGILKGGTINLVPDESFEFSSETFYKNDIFKGDIGIKKDGIIISLFVPGGSIQDMGIIQLSEITEAPETGYIESAAVVIGHSYCIRDNNNRYAKFQVTYVEGSETGQTSTFVSINWIYQEKETRILKPQ